jgi:hypothetical protein
MRLERAHPRKLVVMAIGFILSSISIHPSHLAAQTCGSTKECAQTAVEAAKNAVDAVGALKGALKDKLSNMETVHSPAIKCSEYHDWAALNPNKDPWPHVITRATCAPGTVLITGGCSFTCLQGEFVHALSAPTAPTTEVPKPNSWECGLISRDSTRTYAAVARCLRLE